MSPHAGIGQDGRSQDLTIQDLTIQDHVPGTVTVALRVELPDDQIRTLQIMVIDRDQFTEELHMGVQTIGFIPRAGNGLLSTECHGKENKDG